MFISKQRRGGFTLPEVMVSAAVGGLVLAGLATAFLTSNRSLALLASYEDLNRESRHALHLITRDIRQANSLRTLATNGITLNHPAGDLTYAFNAGAKTLTRTVGGTSEVILRGCVNFSASIYQRNPTGGSYDSYPAATVATCKVIEVGWSCSRSQFGTPVATQTARSAKIVIRKG